MYLVKLKHIIYRIVIYILLREEVVGTGRVLAEGYDSDQGADMTRLLDT